MLKRNILLNPGPATTSDKVKRALLVPDICPREREFGALIDSIRQDLIDIAHGGDEYIAVIFAASGTGGVEAAITSAVLLGRRLFIIENGAYGNRMVKIAKSFNIETVVYKIPHNAYPDVSKIERILQQNSDVSHLAIVHHETTTGMLNPVQDIAAIAHKYDVEVIVDAISSFPIITPRIHELGAEYLVSSSNKCIQGMAGVTFIIVKKSAFAKLEPNRRSFYFDIYTQYDGFNKTHQMPYTPPVQVLYALKQAINEYQIETEAGRQKRYEANWQYLYNGMIELGFKPFLPYECESKILFTLYEPENPRYSFETFHDFLYDRGFTIYPGKVSEYNTFRLAVMGDIYQKDIEAFLKEVKKYITENQIEVM